MVLMVAVLGDGPLGDDDDAVAPPGGVALLDPLDDAVDVVGDLGEQDDVGVAGDARVHGDPAGVAPHHLDDHDPLVRLGGGVQAIDRLGGDRHRGVEAEGRLGAGEVVVDGLGDADDRASPSAMKRLAIRNAPSPPIAISASPPTSWKRRMISSETSTVDLLAVPLGDELERVPLVDGAEDGAAEVGDAAHLVAGQLDEPVLRAASRRPW